jgi:hypothetical protein
MLQAHENQNDENMGFASSKIANDFKPIPQAAFSAFTSFPSLM